jgi:very-short-patch-repair endonuclease
VITRSQLLGHGVHHNSIKRMLTSEKISAPAAGVYLVRGAPLTYRARLWVAVLATDGVLGFATAAQLWGVIDAPPAEAAVHVAVSHTRRVYPPKWVRVHRVTVPARQVVEREESPRTARAWTLCDYLPTLRSGDAIQLADRALQRRWMQRDDIANRLRDYPNRHGNPRLRALLDLTSDGAAAESERRLHAILRRAGIGGWRPNYEIWAGGELIAVADIAFPLRRLIIEVDGMAYHVNADRFQHDRTRQNRLIAGGWTILRFTWTDITERSEYILAAIQTVAA